MPDSVAFFGKNIEIYWHGMFVAVGMIAALVCCIRLRRLQQAGMTCVGVAGAIGLPLGVLLSRAQYSAFTVNTGKGDGFLMLGSLDKGGYALYGALFGAFIALWITTKIYKEVDFPALLDCAAPAAAIGIAIGRMGAYFSHEELGALINNHDWQWFPFSVQAGDGKWYMAVFSFETVAGLITFLATMALFRVTYKKPRFLYRRGNVFILFVMMYASSQTLFESWRTDSMRMKSNGFVRVSQIISAVLLLAMIIIALVRLGRRYGIKLWQIPLYAVIIGMFTLAFVMEFRMNEDAELVNNSLMCASLFILCCVGAAILIDTHRILPGEDTRETRLQLEQTRG